VGQERAGDPWSILATMAECQWGKSPPPQYFKVRISGASLLLWSARPTHGYARLQVDLIIIIINIAAHDELDETGAPAC